jgi:hypothetical protein
MTKEAINMTDEEKSFQIYAFANQRRMQEDQLYGSRTASFLTASAFLFAGFVVLLVSGIARPLAIFVCILGLFLAFLQNRNTLATKRGRGIWEGILHRATEGIEGKSKELLLEAGSKSFRGWGPFAPTPIQAYWLPGSMSVLWIISLILV